ncbi:MAG: DUF1127 domain-containing protein [Hyphomicrobiaceae bacterium]|nr:DUF1127 domain-containing protein [Hyphomicrobiaceae bacterium]
MLAIVDRALGRLTGRARASLRQVAHRRAVDRTMRALESLDDHGLKDIGLTRSQISSAAHNASEKAQTRGSGCDD